MIGEYIFETIRDNIPAVTYDGVTHVYPATIPDGVSFTDAIIYTKLTSTPVYTQVGTDIQLTCVSKTFAGAESLTNDILKLFRNKNCAGGDNDIIYTTVKSIIDLPYDRESEVHSVGITIYIKSVLAN